MTAVFVHGNPETAAIWQPLLAELSRDDVITLSPPGFGAPAADGFEATFDEYVTWLIAELETIGEPVDLVGHDWGANFVLGVASERPDLLRSWCADTGGSWAPDYVWHESARIWQTPGEGEAAVAAWLDMGTAARGGLNESLGMSTEVAAETAEAFDEAMGRCILGVYRSIAEQGLAPWRDRLPNAATRPGLILIPTADEYTGGEALHRWTAERTGARVAVLEDLGHWWMLQGPAAGAKALARFWFAIDFVPDEFVPPVAFTAGDFRLEPLGPQHNERDYAAWISSIEHIRRSPGYPDGTWPREMSVDENRADLVRHAQDFANRSGFTYTVLDSTDDVVGCVYVYPARDGVHDAVVQSWVRESEAATDDAFRRAIADWITSDVWPFERPLYEPLLT